ncbi:igE-binding protein-like, partial [Aphis craccivora]
PMLITSTVTKTFERICLDIVGPLPPRVGDELSRYVSAIALTTTDASTVAQAFVENFVCIYGIPCSILTDCGTNFLSDIFKNIRLIKVERVTSYIRIILVIKEETHKFVIMDFEFSPYDMVTFGNTTGNGTVTLARQSNTTKIRNIL